MARKLYKLKDLREKLNDPKFSDDMDVWMMVDALSPDDDEDTLLASYDGSVQVRDGRVVIGGEGRSNSDLAKIEHESRRWGDGLSEEIQATEPSCCFQCETKDNMYYAADDRIWYCPDCGQEHYVDHVLKIIALRDAQAECSCGRWTFAAPTFDHDQDYTIRRRILHQHSQHTTS